MARLADYASERVEINWGGVPLSVGLSEGTFASFSRNNDNLVEHVGADGRLTLTVIPNKTGAFELECAQNSISNQILSGVQEEFDRDRVIRRADMVLADPSGGGLVFAFQAYIKKPADFAFAAEEQTNRTWMFGCERLVYVGVPKGAVPELAGQLTSDELTNRLSAIQTDFTNI